MAALHNLEQKLLTEQREVEHLRTQVSTLKNNLDDLRTATRMLEAGPVTELTGHDDHNGKTVTGPDRTHMTATESRLPAVRSYAGYFAETRDRKTHD